MKRLSIQSMVRVGAMLSLALSMSAVVAKPALAVEIWGTFTSPAQPPGSFCQCTSPAGVGGATFIGNSIVYTSNLKQLRAWSGQANYATTEAKAFPQGTLVRATGTGGVLPVTQSVNTPTNITSHSCRAGWVYP